MCAKPTLDLSPNITDTVRKTTCYMCACRCGIDVFLRKGSDGKEMIRYIQGNKDHPVNRGVLCAKGSAGIMQHYSPARLNAPLKRVGPRGSGQFEEISWDEAMDIAVSWLKPIRESDPKRLAFFPGRDQSQSLTGWWAQQYGTPNYAAHGGFCSVNMAAAGLYMLGGAFWEFGQPDWERTRYVMIFGVAEDHDSNPIKMGIAKAKRNGAKVIGINPVRTGYNAVADEWVGITPGTDGLFVLALIHELFRTGNVDLDYLLNWTNAGWLVNNDPKSPELGMFLRDADAKPLIWDRKKNKALPNDDPEGQPSPKGEVTVDGIAAIPVFELMAQKYLAVDNAPDAVAERCGINAKTIKRIAAEIVEAAFENEVVVETPWTDWLGRRHERFVGRPVALHAMRGISAHSNGFQTCRTLHLLQLLIGAVEVPGGFRFKPPYPKPVDAHPTPTSANTKPNGPLNGPHLGLPRGPEDLLLNDDGTPARIDKAFTWDMPLSIHGAMHTVISNAATGDPYKIDTLFLYMANMAWNSSMNTSGTIDMLTAKDDDDNYTIPHIIYSDAYSSEMVAYADLILPDTTYLERHDCISLLDRPISEPDAVADSIRWPVVEPDRDVRGFQSTLIALGARLQLPGFVTEDGSAKYSDYADYMVSHERRPGVGPLGGWRGADGESEGRAEPNPNQLMRYIENGGFWKSEIPESARYMKQVNKDYQEWAVGMGFFDKPQPYQFQLYVEPLRKFQAAAEGHGPIQPPEHLRSRVAETFDPLPIWYPDSCESEEYPLHAITQRPAAMYHSWGSQNAWLRQLHTENALYVPATVCDKAGIEDGGWAWLISDHARIRAPVRRMEAVNRNTVWTWNAVGKRSGAWALSEDANEAQRGFLLNHLISELLPPKEDGLRWSNSDPITGQAAWYDLRVRIEKAPPPPDGASEPHLEPQESPVGTGSSGDLTYGKDWT